jgi:hypothetical protein
MPRAICLGMIKTRINVFLCNVILGHVTVSPTRWYLIHCIWPTTPKFIQPESTSSNLIKHHQTSSNFIQPFQILPSLTQDHPILPNHICTSQPDQTIYFPAKLQIAICAEPIQIVSTFQFYIILFET